MAKDISSCRISYTDRNLDHTIIQGKNHQKIPQDGSNINSPRRRRKGPFREGIRQ